MPALSDTMNNGRLVKWNKKIGDAIKKGESIADVETDKAVMDVEAFHDGYLAGPLAAAGSEMPVGAIMGYIADSPEAAASTASAASSASSASSASAASPASSTSRARVSPYARRLAEQLGVDVRQVGSQGEVHADAVRSASGQSPGELAAGPPYRLERPSSVRDAVARKMTAGLSIPMFRVTARLSMAPLLAVARDSHSSVTLLLARVCALTVKVHGLFNAAYTSEGLALRDRVDVGIAIDTPDGLIAPVIRDVAARPFSELADDWRVARDKALNRRLTAQDSAGATFYLSNLGQFSVVHSFDALLPAGAAAILGVAAADGDRTSFTLGCDHRVLAGADAARFLQTFAAYLEDPGRVIQAQG